jgi:hypothetical protein
MTNGPHYLSDVVASLQSGATPINSPRIGHVNKFVDTFISNIDKRSFEPHVFAYALVNQSAGMQPEVFKVVVAILNAYADKYQAGACRSDEEYNIASSAMFILDQLRIISQGP